jgi:multidrug resistance efflux pump
MGRTGLRNSRLFLRFLPVLVWLGAVAGVAGLFHRRIAQFEVVGIANAEVHDVGTNTRARVISVPVQLFTKVTKGDPVAVVSTVLDDERIEAAKAVIQAEIKSTGAQRTELRKNYEAEIYNRQSEWWAELRAFTSDLVAARLRIQDVNSAIENDRAMLNKILLDNRNFWEENAANFGTDITLFNKYKTMEASRKTLEEKIKRDTLKLANNKKELEDAKDRRERYIKYQPQPGIDPNEAQHITDLIVAALQQELNELEERQRELVLTAPCDGFVSNINTQVGEVVILPDFPVVAITEEKPSSIIAYVSENMLGHFAGRKEVEIIKGSVPKQIGRSEIINVGPRVEQLPQRLWRNQAIPQWGRAVQIEIPIDMKLLPNELVVVRVL